MRGPVDHDQTERDRDQVRIGRLKRRADFLRVAQGQRWHGSSLTLQSATRQAPSAEAPSASDATLCRPRVGFTLTKKVGCAVVRNRARRRLKEAVRLSSGLPLRPDGDYVIVGRHPAIRLPFVSLCEELARAVDFIASRDERRDNGRKARHRGPGRPEADRADLVNTRPEP